MMALVACLERSVLLRAVPLSCMTLDYSMCVTTACRGHPEHVGTTLRHHQYSEHDAELNRSQRSHLLPTVTTPLWLCASLQAHFCDETQKGGMRQPKDGLRTPPGCPPHHFLPPCGADDHGEGWSRVWEGGEISKGRQQGFKERCCTSFSKQGSRR